MKFEKNYVSMHFPDITDESVLSMYPPGLLHCLSSGEIRKIIEITSEGVFRVQTQDLSIFDWPQKHH